MTRIQDRLTGAIRTTLRQFGGPVTLSRRATTSYDPATGATTVVVVSTEQANGVLLGKRVAFVPGETAQRFDREAILDGGVPQPAVGDILTAGGEQWEVASVRPHIFQTAPIAWRLGLRRGA